MKQMDFSKASTLWTLLLLTLAALAVLVVLYWQGGLGHVYPQ